MLAAFQELNQHFINLWQESSTRFPDLGPTYPEQAQTQNEKSLHRFLDQVEHILAHPPRSREEGRSAQLRIGTAFRCLAEETVGIQGEQLDLFPSNAFSDVSEEFVRKAHLFDPRLSATDIYQAGRNAWTAHGLQWLLGIPVQLTPSLLAYSLLYPYTDNYIDDPEISRLGKQAFIDRFGRRLAGETLTPVDVQERMIFELVGMIENQYSRSKDPAVFESLLAIHHAQGQSLGLQHSLAASLDLDVPGISFYKGGTSVLADGYLAAGSLDSTERQYMYGHGILAQLVDDMEDIEEDSCAGRLTIYSQELGHQMLDALACRTFHFGQRILMGLNCFDVDDAACQLIRRGADLLLIDVIGRTDRYYSASFVHELESHSPFHFSFLKEQRNDFLRRHGPLGKQMERFMVLF